MKNFIQPFASLTILTLSASSLVLALSTVSCKTKTAALPQTTAETIAPGVAPQPTNSNTVSGASVPKGYYTCGMHPEVRSLDPDGKCPFCQMPLLPAENVEVTDPDSGKTYTAANFPAISGYYSCRAHPTVLSHDAGDKCPVCGRSLLPVESSVFRHDQ
jgi:Heavy metal binding domain